MDDRHELRADLIAALMSHEQMTYADAERFVESFERLCRNCGSMIEDAAVHELAGTIWAEDSR